MLGTDATMPSGSARAAVRTCAGCRRQDGRDALLRFVAGPRAGSLVPDVRRRLPGRGVSVHPDPGCVLQALRRGGFARGLRRPVSVDAEQLLRDVAAAYRRRVDGLVVTARRAGRAAVGTDAVREALARGRLALLLVATDAANRRDELVASAEAGGVPWVVHGDRCGLGGLLGRAEVAVLGVDEPALARLLADTVEKAEIFEVACGATHQETKRGSDVVGPPRREDKAGGTKVPTRSEGP